MNHGSPTDLRPVTPAAPLRVLLALEAAGGGAGRHLLDLAGELLRRGHAVHLAWSAQRVEPPFLAALALLPTLVQHPVAMQRAPGVADMASVHGLRRVLREQGPFDVAHGHSSKAGALLRLAAIGTGVPVVYTPHAFVTLDPSLPATMRVLYRGVERLLAPLAARIICVSEDERRHALDLGIDRRRLAVVANGIAPLPPPERAAQRHRLGLAYDELCIGGVGRLSGQKAMDRLVSAFAAIAPVHPRARLVLVGDGPESRALEAQVHEIGLDSRVIFTGQADGAALMAAFDVFALPSRYEGLPYVLLEAAARGLPIVATAVGGADVVVQEGENGFIVAQADAEAGLAARLGQLLADAPLRERMGQRARELAAAFGIGRMVEEILVVYRSVAQAR